MGCRGSGVGFRGLAFGVSGFRAFIQGGSVAIGFKRDHVKEGSQGQRASSSRTVWGRLWFSVMARF